MGVVLCACGSRTEVSAVSGDEPFDSLTIEIDSMAVSMTMKIIGTADDTLARRCLAQFVGETMFFMEDDDGHIIRPAYEGSLRNYLRACAHQKWEELRDDTFGRPDGGDEPSEMPSPAELVAGLEDDACLSSYLIIYNKVYDSDDYVSWAGNYDFYVQGTAHPSYGGTGVTFRKTDGSPIGHELLKDTDSWGFRQLLKEGLRQWLNEVPGINADTDEELKEALYGETLDPNALPLPEQRPYLTEDGVVLSYQENELTFTREPAVITIPYDKARPYLQADIPGR